MRSFGNSASLKQSNELYVNVKNNITQIEADAQRGCPFAKEIQFKYDLWSKNTMNKEVALQLKAAFEKWNKKKV